MTLDNIDDFNLSDEEMEKIKEKVKKDLELELSRGYHKVYVDMLYSPENVQSAVDLFLRRNDKDLVLLKNIVFKIEYDDLVAVLYRPPTEEEIKQLLDERVRNAVVQKQYEYRQFMELKKKFEGS
jgi:hypothetical protein